MNYIKDVAKLLGVELLEEFEIIVPNTNCKATAMFDENELYIKETNIHDASTWKPYVLKYILNGTYVIKRKPWKPEDGEEYYYISYNGKIVNWVMCRDDWSDIIHYKLGNCYKTKEEAEKNIDKWTKFYLSDDVIEV